MGLGNRFPLAIDHDLRLSKKTGAMDKQEGEATTVGYESIDNDREQYTFQWLDN